MPSQVLNSIDNDINIFMWVMLFFQYSMSVVFTVV